MGKLKAFPAINVVHVADPDLFAAAVDEFSPTAIEPRESDIRVFFATPADRDAARAALAPSFDVTAIDVPDEDWARRSQEDLEPITVGRIIVATPWAVINQHLSAIGHPPSAISPQPSALLKPSAILIVIAPSMGFGTGHHATTRLCLAALQTIDLTGQAVLDIGTGSGVLAIAAERLGAVRASGIDNDPDAIQSARENLEVNPAVRCVMFDIGDLTSTLPVAFRLRSGQADVVTANLTGALLVRSASALLATVRAGGTLILSGLLAHERDEVCRAFAPAIVVWEREEDGWVGLAMKKS